MTSAELKHRAELQEWAAQIQECRSSGLSVSEWCRQQGVTTTLLASFSGIPLSFAEAQILPSKKTVKMLRSGMTALPTHRVIEEAYRLGASFVLPKPFTTRALAERIHDALHSDRP